MRGSSRPSRLDLSFVRNKIVEHADPESIALDYLNALAALVPNARVEFAETAKGDHKSSIKVGNHPLTVFDLLPHTNAWYRAADQMLGELQRASSATE